jgi:hypothetical protein
MMRRPSLKSTVSDSRRRSLTRLRVLGASVILTMRLFDTLPEWDLRPRTAIVRDLPRGGRFDPRERLPNGTVLTLPFVLDADHPPRRPAKIGPN